MLRAGGQPSQLKAEPAQAFDEFHARNAGRINVLRFKRLQD
jgi:hypothetical protein